MLLPPVQQRHAVSHPPTQAHVPEEATPMHVLYPRVKSSHVQHPQSDGEKIIPAPPAGLTAPAHHALKSTSAPSSPMAPPSALASALIGVGTAHALGLSSPRVQTSDEALLDSPKERGTAHPLLSVISPRGRTPILGREGADGGLGLSNGDEAMPHSPLDEPRDGEHDDHEEGTIQRARRASIATATFKTLNPAVGLDAEIERRSSPAISEIPAPELVYYGSGANKEDEEDDEAVVETFKSLNPHVSLETEIARRSSPSSPVPQVFLAPQLEEEDEGPVETFKSLNPAVSLDTEILRRSRAPSPVPQFKELNEELSFQREIVKRAASPSSSPQPRLAEEGGRFANSANQAECGGSGPMKRQTTPNRSLVRATLLLPFILCLRMMNVFNPFAYLYLIRTRSRSTCPPEPYPKIPRSLLQMIVPAFIWRWTGKDPSYNLQRVGLGKGINTVGTRYDGSGASLPPKSA